MIYASNIKTFPGGYLEQGHYLGPVRAHCVDFALAKHAFPETVAALSGSENLEEHIEQLAAEARALGHSEIPALLQVQAG